MPSHNLPHSFLTGRDLETQFINLVMTETPKINHLTVNLRIFHEFPCLVRWDPICKHEMNRQTIVIRQDVCITNLHPPKINSTVLVVEILRDSFKQISQSFF